MKTLTNIADGLAMLKSSSRTDDENLLREIKYIRGATNSALVFLDWKENIHKVDKIYRRNPYRNLIILGLPNALINKNSYNIEKAMDLTTEKMEDIFNRYAIDTVEGFGLGSSYAAYAANNFEGIEKILLGMPASRVLDLVMNNPASRRVGKEIEQEGNYSEIQGIYQPIDTIENLDNMNGKKITIMFSKTKQKIGKGNEADKNHSNGTDKLLRELDNRGINYETLLVNGSYNSLKKEFIKL